MSPPAIAKSLVAAMSAETAGLPKPDKRAADKPARLFSQTPVLVAARQTVKPYNVVVASKPKSRLPEGDRSVSITASLSTSVPAANPPTAQARKATPVAEMAQGLEGLTEVVARDAQVCPPLARSSKQQSDKPVNPTGTASKRPAPQGECPAASQLEGLSVATARSVSQMNAGKRLSQPAAASVNTEGAAVPTKIEPTLADRAVPSARQVAGPGGKASEVTSGEAVRGSRNGPVLETTLAAANEPASELRQAEAKATDQPKAEPKASMTTAVAPESRALQKGSAAVKEHAVETRQAETRATAEPQVGSDAQAMAEPAKGHVARVERPAPPNPERVSAESSKPLSGALPNVQDHTRALSSQGHSSQGIPGDGARARHAQGVTTLPTDGREASLSPSGDNPTMPPEPAISEAGKSAAFSRLVSDQTSTTSGFEGSASKGIAQNISEQIRDSIHASLDRGERQVVIRLQPPELGSVMVRFREQNEQIHGILEVSRSETRHEVEQALPEVLRSLQDLGVQVRKFEVTFSDQPDRDLGKQQLHQDAWPQPQGSDRHANQAQRSNFEFRIPDSELPPPVRVPAGRIDMLA